MPEPNETTNAATPAPSTPPAKPMAVLVTTVNVTVKQEDTPREATGGLGSGIASGFKTVTSGVGALISGISELGPAFAAAIREATGYEDAVTSLDAILKSTNNAAGVTKEKLLDDAEAYEQSTKFSDEMVISAQKLMLTFTDVGEKAFPKAMQAALDLSAATGQDLQSSVVQVGQALTDPIQGIADLERAGVSFTKEQKNAIKASVDFGKAGEAQDAILQVLQTRLGGAAQAAGGTFSGQLAILQNSFGDVLETLDSAFLPLLKDLVQWVSREVMPAFKEWAQENAPAIQQALRDLAQWLKSYVLPAIQQLVQWVITNWPLVQQAIEQAWNIIQPVLQAVFAELGRFWTEIQPKLQAAWNSIAQVITQLMQFIQDHSAEFRAIIEGIMTFLSGDIQVVWSVIQGIIKIALDLISGDTTAAAKSWNEMLTGVMDGLSKMVGVAWAAISTIFALALQAIVDAVMAKGAEIRAAMENAISGTVNAVTAKVGEFFNAAAQLVLGDQLDGNGGIVGGVRAMASQIVTEMANAISSARDAVAAKIGEFFEAAKALIVGVDGKGETGLVGGIRSMALQIAAEVGNTISGAVDAITGRVGDFFNAATQLVLGDKDGNGGIIPGIKSKLEDVKTAIQNLIGSAADLLATLPQDIKDKLAAIGSAVVGGIQSRVTGMGDDLAKAFKSVIKSALDAIKASLGTSENPIAQAFIDQIKAAIDLIEAALGIASPSKVFAKIGAQMAAGLAQGFATAPLAVTLAQNTLAGGMAAANTIYQQHYYNLTIHSNASTEQVVADFAMLRALAGA